MHLLRTILVTVVTQTFLINAIILNPSLVSNCTLSCLLETFPAANCTFSDPACQCRNPALFVSTADCLIEHCSLADRLSLGKLREELCDLPIESKARPMLIINLVTVTLSFVAVFLRLMSRCLVSKRIWIDDGIILSAMIFNIALAAIAGWMELNGLGMHIWDVSITKIPKLLELFYVAETLYLAVILLTKVSLLSFYLRIFPRRGFQIITKVALLFVITSGLVILFTEVFQCLPVSLNWDKTESGGRCININALSYINGGLSILQDIIILVLPITELVTLKLGRKQKLGVIFVFQVGAFACVTAMVRLNYLTQFNGTGSVDPTWYNVNTTNWTGIEVNAGIVCSCIPAIRALLKRKYPRHFGSRAASPFFFPSARKNVHTPSSEASQHEKWADAPPVERYVQPLITHNPASKRSTRSKMTYSPPMKRYSQPKISHTSLEMAYTASPGATSDHHPQLIYTLPRTTYTRKEKPNTSGSGSGKVTVREVWLDKPLPLTPPLRVLAYPNMI